jgi:hypothetical protein
MTTDYKCREEGKGTEGPRDHETRVWGVGYRV